MNTKSLLALGALLTASATLAFFGPQALGSNEASPQTQGESPVSVSLGKGSEDGSAVFHLAIYAPWGGATQRTINFSGGFVTHAGLSALETYRVSAAAAGSAPLLSVGDEWQCTATLKPHVASWSQVQDKSDVIMTVTPME